MVLRAYCDESEPPEEGGRRVCTVAAVLGRQEDWELLEPPWKATLEAHGVEVFHMTDFENRKHPQPPYDNLEFWTNERRVGFIVSLIDALALPPGVVGVSCTVIVDEYEAVLSTKEQERFGSPYDFCAMWALNTIAAELGVAGVNHPVAYVFEERQRQGRLREAVEHALAYIPEEKRLASISTVRKAKFVPLQAADLWAYEATKDALRIIGAHDRPERKSLRAMRDKGIPLKAILWDGSKIRELYDDLESGRAYMPEWFKYKDVPRKHWPRTPSDEDP